MIRPTHLPMAHHLHFYPFPPVRINWQPHRIRSLKPIRIKHHYLVYISDGEGEMTVDGVHYSLTPGKLFLLLPGHLVETRFYPRKTAGVNLLRFACQALTASVEEFLTRDVEISISCLSEIERLLDQLRQLRHADEPWKQWKAQLLFQQLVFTLATGSGRDRDHQAEENQACYTMNRVAAYLREHYRESVQMNELAELHGISPSNFATAFRKHTGLTPTQYLAQLRIERSKELLLSRQPLKNVARKIGYNDELYFSRIFKKLVGVAPTIYVRQHAAEHILTLEPVLNDYLCALDVMPMATLQYASPDLADGMLPYIREKLRNVHLLPSSDPRHIRQLLKQNPKMVLGEQQKNRSLAESLNQLAPTILLSIRKDWQSLLFEIANLTERREQYRRWMQQYMRKTEEARRRAASWIESERTVMVLVARKGEFRVYGGKRQLGETLYSALGLTPPAGISPREHYRRVTIDEIIRMKPDVIFLTALTDEKSLEQKRLLKEHPGWQVLDCVRNGRVLEADIWLNHHAPVTRSIAIDIALDFLLQHSS